MKVVIVGHQDRIYKMSFAKIYPLYVIVISATSDGVLIGIDI